MFLQDIKPMGQLIISIIFFIMPLLIVGLRIIARWTLKTIVGWDDYTIVIGTVSSPDDR